MTAPPDDCAIEVSLAPVLDTNLIHFQRMESRGSSFHSVGLDDLGNLTIRHFGNEPHRFTLSFRLPEGDTSGGFAWIKIWPEEESEPCYFPMPGRGETRVILRTKSTTFDLHVYFTDHDHPGKATLLSLGNEFSASEKFHYALGICDGEGNVKRIDPRIHNNWEPGDGGRPGWRRWWTALLRSRR